MAAAIGLKISKKGVSYEKWGFIGVENNTPFVDFQAQASVNGESLQRRNKSWYSFVLFFYVYPSAIYIYIY